jgi:hypothetical protein
MKHLPKINRWENGCGVNVGKHVIYFTGITNNINPSHQGVYVTLKSVKTLKKSKSVSTTTWMCPPLIFIPNRYARSLHSAISKAKQIYSRDKLNIHSQF